MSKWVIALRVIITLVTSSLIYNVITAIQVVINN